MKLTPDSTARLEQLITTVTVAGIKKLVIEPNRIRGIDEKQAVVIFTDRQVPDLGGKQVGINRVDALFARLNLVKTQGDLQIDATESTSNQSDISLLDMVAGKTKAQFRCASVEAVKGVPKNVTDTLVWEIKVTAKLIPTLAQGVTAMSSETITLASRDGTGVTFEFVDANKDVFTTAAEEAPTWIGQGTPATSFCQKYPAKTFIILLREATKYSDTVSLSLGEGGILSLNVNGFDFYLIPTP